MFYCLSEASTVSVVCLFFSLLGDDSGIGELLAVLFGSFVIISIDPKSGNKLTAGFKAGIKNDVGAQLCSNNW